MPTLANPVDKGGVGKTVETVALAEYFASQGDDVLVVDLDPQANASRRLGVEWNPGDDFPTTSEVIKNADPEFTKTAIQGCGWATDHPATGRIDVIPSRFDLDNRETEAGTVGAGARLRRALRGITPAYTWTLLDCRPSLGHLSQLALGAADGVVAVVEPSKDPINAVGRLVEFLEAWAEELHPGAGLHLVGIMVNRYRSNTNLHRSRVREIEQRFPGKLMYPLIPLRVSLEESQDLAVPISTVSPKSAAQFAEIGTEIRRRLRVGAAAAS